MNTATDTAQTPAQLCVRASRGVTVLALVVGMLIFVLPTSWLQGVSYFLALGVLALACIGLAIAVAAAAVRGAEQSAGAAIILIGANLFVALFVIVALFQFRFSAP